MVVAVKEYFFTLSHYVPPNSKTFVNKIAQIPLRILLHTLHMTKSQIYMNMYSRKNPTKKWLGLIVKKRFQVFDKVCTFPKL